MSPLGIFWKFLWTERRSLADFLKWGARMRQLEAQRRDLHQF
jgi:hypothetical protein